MGMALVAKHIVSACQCNGDKGNAVLAVHFITWCISTAKQAQL